MTAPEPTAVERTIAEVLAVNVWVGFRDEAGDDDSAEGVVYLDDRRRLAQAVVAAIRNLPPAEMAELIEGKVERGHFLQAGIGARAVGRWQKVCDA
ncbi:MAG: hypothetical protein ACTHQ3_15895 [Motilibacteraceae bacterium]